MPNNGDIKPFDLFLSKPKRVGLYSAHKKITGLTVANRFENKSKLTLFIVLAISLFLLMIAFEILVGYTLGTHTSETRHIRLRENAPHLNLKIKPSAIELSRSENLENKEFPFATDENGFILPSLNHKQADVTLAFIGGSTTECMLVDTDKRFPYLTGKLLSKDSLKVNTINAGVSGNDSLNSINAYLNKIVPRKPDIAILMHNVNDLSTLLHEGSYWNNNDYRSPIIYEDRSLKSFIKASMPNTFEVLHRLKTAINGPVDEFSHNRKNKKEIDQDKFYTLFEENLNIFISISKAKGIQPVLMTQASRFTEKPDQIIADSVKVLESLGINYSQYKTLYDGMNDRIRKVATTHNITLIDLAKSIPQSNEYIIDSVHYNNQGSELVAKIISEKLNTVININK